MVCDQRHTLIPNRESSVALHSTDASDDSEIEIIRCGDGTLIPNSGSMYDLHPADASDDSDFEIIRFTGPYIDPLFGINVCPPPPPYIDPLFGINVLGLHPADASDDSEIEIIR